MIKKNLFKRALSGDKPLIGLWQSIPDPTVAEIGAGAGFDWVLIDAEHGPFDLRSIMTHLQAMESYPVSALVRLVEGNTALIKQLLDVGAQTLLVPMVDTAEQALQIVRAAKYPPVGVRGLGTSMARAANWNRNPDYLHQANDEICVIVQIETMTAIDNIESIDVGNPGHPDVVSAVERGFKVIQNAGKSAGVLAVTKDLVEKYLQAGAKFIGVGVDAALLANATKQLASKYIDNVDGDESAGY